MYNISNYQHSKNNCDKIIQIILTYPVAFLTLEIL